MLPESFHFLRPAWLLAAPAILPFLWLALRARGTASAWRRVCDPELLAELVSRADSAASRWPAALLAAGWLTACLALAGPTWERLPQPSYRTPASSVLVVNLSPSMDATDVAPSRLGRARFEVMDALAGLSGEQLALVIFSEEPYTVTPLSDDPAVIGAQVPVLATGLMPGHGTRVDRAIDHAAELLRRSGAAGGRILLVTDGAGDDADAAVAAAARAAGAGLRVSVLGVGTEEGAPVPGRRGFARDSLGNPVVAKLLREPLEAIARAGGGRFAVATADDSDLHALMPPAEPVPGFAGELVASGLRTDVWRDMGAWLLGIPLLCAPLAFRRGWASTLLALLLLGGTTALPADARAAGLDDWLARPDQQGARALAEGRPADAAKLFEDPAWRAAALYRAEDYAGAAEALRDQRGPEARYNLGNALARAGQLEQALAAYDEALAAEPGHEDARFNRDLVAKLLEDQKQQQPPQDQEQKGQGQQQDQQQQDQQQQDQQQADPSQQSDQEQESAQQQQQRQQEQSQPDSQQGQDSQPSQSAQAERQQADGKDAQDQREQEPQPDAQQPADAAGTDEPKESAKAQQAPQGGEQTGPRSERELALEQWLNRIPDDPGGLLREKLRRQYAQRRYGR